VDELIQGRHAPTDLTLPGKFDPTDDFNDQPAPYHFVRPTGRWGSCYSDRYRRGASYLLFLKTRDGTWTTHWDALAPLNEQLHGKDDPWVVWVRKQAGGKAVASLERPTCCPDATGVAEPWATNGAGRAG
jgi:hypothetical protein